MKIAMIAPPWIPIPPTKYGGIERVLMLLVDSLVECGVEVTLYAAAGTKTKAKLVSFINEDVSTQIGNTIFDALHVGGAFRDILSKDNGFDIIHDHSGFIGVAFSPLSPIPVVHTVHGPMNNESSLIYGFFSDYCNYVAISSAQARVYPEIPFTAVVHNSIDIRAHPYSKFKEDYVLCLARICKDKGTHIGIKAAVEAGERIIVAGKRTEAEEIDYFNKKVEPLIDNINVFYLGEVEDFRRVELMKKAKALLVPIQWDEPFGLNMVEAQACGTPVIAFRRGSVPEVVNHGETGFIAKDFEEMVSFIKCADSIDPKKCRDSAFELFRPEVMRDKYLALYKQLTSMPRTIRLPDSETKTPVS